MCAVLVHFVLPHAFTCAQMHTPDLKHAHQHRDVVHNVVQRASLRGNAGVTASQADMKVVRISQTSDAQSFIGLRLPKSVIAQVRKALDEQVAILSGNALKVTVDSQILAQVPSLMCAHYGSEGRYKGRATVGSTMSDIILHFAHGKLTLGILHNDKWSVPHLPVRALLLMRAQRPLFWRAERMM
jgi:hypothetical protein